MITTNLVILYDASGALAYQGQVLTIPDVAGQVRLFLAAMAAGAGLFGLILSYRKGKAALDAASE
jgi:hypothetical protein